jgi:RimJ/RimL family protein N-acetyltransferase
LGPVEEYFGSRRIVVKGNIVIRHIAKDDAAAYLELCKTADAQSDYLLFEAGERTTSVEEMSGRVEKALSSPNSTILLAADGDGRLVGYLSVTGGEAKRNMHSAYIVIAILDGHRGMGIGSMLFRELEAWAKAKGIRRLSLGLMAENERAHALYAKMGFLEEGRKKEAFRLPGRYVDEILMYKLLDISRE